MDFQYFDPKKLSNMAIIKQAAQKLMKVDSFRPDGNISTYLVSKSSKIKEEALILRFKLNRFEIVRCIAYQAWI